MAIVPLLICLLFVGGWTRVLAADHYEGKATVAKVNYVSPTGNDKNPGTEDAPWATLA